MVSIETFKKILKLDQNGLKKLVFDYLKNTNKYNPMYGDGFVYAKGDIPILLVAHLDTVHKTKPKNIYYDEQQGVMWSPEGIGGDDRCGVYIITKLIEEFKPYVLFTEDEEIGCVGAKKTIDTIIDPNVKFIIEIDRRGSNDCVFYDCGNKEFKEYIESFGFKTALGSYSDICTLSEEWEVASVNLSSGYYNEHTLQETINVNDMTKTYERVKKILADKDSKYFDYKKVEHTTYPTLVKEDKEDYKKTKKDLDNYRYYDSYGYVDSDGFYRSWDGRKIEDDCLR